MNKYLKGFLNCVIVLVVGFIGLTFSMSALAMGSMFFPDILIKADQYLSVYHSPISIGERMVCFFIPLMPLCFLLTVLAVSALLMFITVRLMKRVDIEKIIAKIK